MHVEGLPELAIVLGLGLGDHAGGGHGCGTGRGGGEAAAVSTLPVAWGFRSSDRFAPLHSSEE